MDLYTFYIDISFSRIKLIWQKAVKHFIPLKSLLWIFDRFTTLFYFHNVWIDSSSNICFFFKTYNIMLKFISYGKQLIIPHISDIV